MSLNYEFKTLLRIGINFSRFSTNFSTNLWRQSVLGPTFRCNSWPFLTMGRHSCALLLTLLCSHHTLHLELASQTPHWWCHGSARNASMVPHGLQDKIPHPFPTPLLCYWRAATIMNKPLLLLLFLISNIGITHDCIALCDLIYKYLKVSFFSSNVSHACPWIVLAILRLNSNATSSIKPGQRHKQQKHGDQQLETFQGPKKKCTILSAM